MTLTAITGDLARIHGLASKTGRKRWRSRRNVSFSIQLPPRRAADPMALIDPLQSLPIAARELDRRNSSGTTSMSSRQPIFETSRLLVRPRTLADTDACLAMDRDPEVTRFVSGPWSDPIAHKSFIKKRTRGPYPAGLGYWTVALRADKASFVGWVLLIPIDGKGPEIEIGWRLCRHAWGKGYGTEAATPVLRHAFVTLKLSEVIAEIDPENAGSLRVAEKLGLKPRGMTSNQGKAAMCYTLTLQEAVDPLSDF